ncbi:hypothetical protein GYMLUDRAFT_261397 [Collybiopsis luxurians FD-317 M1]|uniref:Uncharacterized protein n=1 Tax=Collybiopsis luxurians FD-317 M1 TaxID=944289 RepID=A0A0D0CNQ1_9AGAR|nr:hypothetical protein GYMLUDRAFT_261397 [Collybiopsis luxurians FD-317 M1]
MRHFHFLALAIVLFFSVVTALPLREALPEVQEAASDVQADPPSWKRLETLSIPSLPIPTPTPSLPVPSLPIPSPEEGAPTAVSHANSPSWMRSNTDASPPSWKREAV